MLCLALFAYRPNPDDPAANAGPVLLAGMGGLAAGALVAWALARGVGNAWRRAMLSMMAVMGTAVIAALTMPAHAALGTWGLALLFAACLAAIALARRLLLARTPDP